MANPDTLFIKYHPARKDVVFKIFEGDKEIKGAYESLEKYSLDKKGSFVLNLQGNKFFEDILKPFTGKEFVNVSMRTTRVDYEDFKRRVSEYNKSRNKNECEIILQELNESDELADMKTSFLAIKEEGEKISKLLGEHWSKINNISCSSENARLYLCKVAEKIKKEKENIDKDLLSLSEDNNVNICLIGVHSSGKSTLINTILGYKILPVDIRPETAKMLKIKGVKNIDSSSITFSIDDKICRIIWDAKTKNLKIADANIDNSFKVSLEKELLKNKTERIDVQLYRALDFLNKDETLNAHIDLGFPIPLNNSDLQFTIYDTPGSDSNVSYHRKVLNEALENQTNSILIYVLIPDSISGTGNLDLIKDLLDRRQNSNNIIDIEQSFFVFNKADTDKQLDVLGNSELKKCESDPEPVKLSDKKVFFISSRNAFAAVATKNGVAGEEEEYDMAQNCPGSYHEKFGRYYNHNHYGTSEYATKLMIENANNALKIASEKNDEIEKYLICSGVYSLEEEIKNYGERYASSVKTAAIIKSIEGAAVSLSKMVKETSLGTDEKVKDLRGQLESEIKKVEEIIDATSQKYSGRPEGNNELENLGIGPLSFQNNVLIPVEDTLNKRLEKFLFLFNVHVNDMMKEAVLTDISEIYKKYTENYEIQREKHLRTLQNKFIKDFLSSVENDSSLSEEIKKQLQNFNAPNPPKFGLNKKVTELFDAAKLFEHQTIKNFFKAVANGATFISEKVDESIAKDSSNELSINPITNVDSYGESKKTLLNKAKGLLDKTRKVLTQGMRDSKKWVIQPTVKGVKEGTEKLSKSINEWETKTVSKKQFINDVKDWFQKNQQSITEKFVDDIDSALKQMCCDLEEEFKGNIERYSTKIKALREDNEPLEKLADDIVILQKEIASRKDELEEKI